MQVEILMEIRHENSTTLLGFCNEGSNIGLIYEYMPNGNLRYHVHHKILSWEHRLRIAIEAAQGLQIDSC